MNLIPGLTRHNQQQIRDTYLYDANCACAQSSFGRAQIFFSYGLLVPLFCAGLALSQNARADLMLFNKDIDVRLDAGYMYDDNVNRAKEPAERLSDRSGSATLSGVMFLPQTANTRVLATASLGVEKFGTYSGLNHFTASLQGEYQYRGSAEFGTPIYAAFLKTYVEQYESTLRSGSRYSAGMSIRKPVTDRIHFFGAVARNQRYGKSAVFNVRDNSARFNLDYALSSRSAIYLGAEYRSGDIVSTALPSLENIDTAEVFAEDDAYPGGLLYSYRFKGTTLISTLGYNLALNSQNSLDFSWRLVESKADERPSYATSPSSYIVNQYSLVYLRSF